MKKQILTQLMCFGLVSLAIMGCKSANPSSDAPSDGVKAEEPAIAESMQREVELFRSVDKNKLDAPKLDDELKVLMKKAEMNDDEAREKLGVYFMSLPKSRESVKQGRAYLRAVKTHKDGQAAYLRGYDELWDPIRMYSEDMSNASRKHIHEAAKLGDPKALAMTLDFPGYRLKDVDVITKLNEYYEAKLAEKRDPKLVYEWAKAIEPGPFERISEQFPALLQEAAKANVEDARLHYALILMADTSKTEDWKTGFGYLKDAAMAGNAEASNEVARLIKEYQEYGEDYDNDRKVYFSTLINLSGKSADELIKEFKMGAMGLDLVCEEFAGTDNDALVKCTEKYLAVGASRDACDLLENNHPWAELKNNGKIDDGVLKKLGSQLLKCRKEALFRGEDYSQQTGLAGPSTAAAIASYYAGNEFYGAKADVDKKLAYLVYGAVNGDEEVLDLSFAGAKPETIEGAWDAQWALAQAYANGEMPADAERQCYWTEVAKASTFCTKVCKTNAEFVEACKTCNDIKAAAKACKEPVKAKKEK